MLAHGLLLTATVPGNALGRGSAVQTHHVEEIVPPPFVPAIQAGRHGITMRSAQSGSAKPTNLQTPTVRSGSSYYTSINTSSRAAAPRPLINRRRLRRSGARYLRNALAMRWWSPP